MDRISGSAMAATAAVLPTPLLGYTDVDYNVNCIYFCMYCFHNMSTVITCYTCC